LDEPSLQVVLLSLRLVEAYVGDLLWELRDILQMFTKLVAELPELCLTVVFKTELESLHRNDKSELIFEDTRRISK
jgi:hypothetical protein